VPKKSLNNSIEISIFSQKKQGNNDKRFQSCRNSTSPLNITIDENEINILDESSIYNKFAGTKIQSRYTGAETPEESTFMHKRQRAKNESALSAYKKNDSV